MSDILTEEEIDALLNHDETFGRWMSEDENLRISNPGLELLYLDYKKELKKYVRTEDQVLQEQPKVAKLLEKYEVALALYKANS